jgi:hypothetical protein
VLTRQVRSTCCSEDAAEDDGRGDFEMHDGIRKKNASEEMGRVLLVPRIQKKRERL